jgi:hypothetical protein
VPDVGGKKGLPLDDGYDRGLADRLLGDEQSARRVVLPAHPGLVQVAALNNGPPRDGGGGNDHRNVMGRRRLEGHVPAKGDHDGEERQGRGQDGFEPFVGHDESPF